MLLWPKAATCWRGGEPQLILWFLFIWLVLNPGYFTLEKWNSSQKFLCFSGGNSRGSPTFGGPGGAQVIDGSQDQPQGLLLLPGHSQDLHGCLEFGELLSSSLLLLGLWGGGVSKVATRPIREKFGKDLGGSLD